jgi:integrase
MPVDQIARKDVAARVVGIEREHGTVTAARARTTLSAFFTWAMGMGIVESNPVVATPAPEEDAPRDRVLSNDELSAVWRACRDDDFGRIVKLLILTGCRRTEIGGMRWSELDLERGLFTVPASRAKNKRAHTLPLPSLALDVIAAVPRMATRDQLFGVRGADGFSRYVDGKREIDERSGVTDWVLHDIRRSAATGMADIGVQPHVIEQVLNHVSGHKAGPAGIYNRSRYGNEVRAALALWADHVRALVTGGERKVLNFQPPQTAS